MNGLEENEEKMEKMELIKEPTGFNWGQVVLAIGVVIALIFASWNAFSIMETGKKMNAEDDMLEANITQTDRAINDMQVKIQSLQAQLDNCTARINVLELACDFDIDGVLDRYDTDDDNDGYHDAEDAFPYNVAEWKDNDGDGIGDNADPDDDNDSYGDTWDVLPYKDAVIRITIISFTLESYSYEESVYFEICIDGDSEHMLRSPVVWFVDVDEEFTWNWVCEYNVPDNGHITDIEIYMFEWSSYYVYLLDIEGKSGDFELCLEYDIVTGEWWGDDDDGYSSGFEDGRDYESDVLFSYNIETV